MGECTSCGTEIDYRDKFCSSCGTLTSAGRPVAEQIGRAVSEVATGLSKLAGQFATYVRDEDNRRQVVIGGAVFGLLLVLLTDNPISNGVSSLFDSEPAAPQFTADGLPDLENYEDAFLSEAAEYVLTGTANVRNYPTSQNTQVVKTLASGTSISARQVKAFDPTAQWYRLADGGYVWGGNLARPDGTSVGGATFPEQFLGRWSSMDTCRGQDLDAIIEILPDGIQFYESYGALRQVSHDYKEREIYHLAMTGEGETWKASYRLMLNGEGMTLVLFDVGDLNQPNLTYHNPKGGCARVLSGE